MSVLLPNRLSTRSTASSAVMLRWSSAGLSSGDVERGELAGVGDHLHAQLGLAVGRSAARTVVPTPGRSSGRGGPRPGSRAGACLGPRRRAPAPWSRACRSHRCSACRRLRRRDRAESASRPRPPLRMPIWRICSGRIAGISPPMPVSISGPWPHRQATGMPWMLPDGVMVAVLRSAWASNHSTRSFAAGLAAVAGHRADRADREAMIAAEHDRYAPFGQFRATA